MSEVYVGETISIQKHTYDQQVIRLAWLEAEVSRLRAAIERHREQNGDTPGIRPTLSRRDAELYKALKGE